MRVLDLRTVILNRIQRKLKAQPSFASQTHKLCRKAPELCAGVLLRHTEVEDAAGARQRHQDINILLVFAQESDGVFDLLIQLIKARRTDIEVGGVVFEPIGLEWTNGS